MPLKKCANLNTLWKNQLLGGFIKNTLKFSATGLWHNVAGGDSQS